MDPVILMVGRTNEGVHDVEVMPDVPSADLADALALAFGWPGTYDIQVAGKMLAAHQSLAEAEIWDGSQLLLVTSTRPPRPAAISAQQAITGGRRALRVPAAQATPSPTATPVGGKRSLQMPSAPSSAPTGAARPLQVPAEAPAAQVSSPVKGNRALQPPVAPPDDPAPAPTSGWKPVLPEPPAQTPLSSPVTGWRQTPTAPAPSEDDDPQP